MMYSIVTNEQIINQISDQETGEIRKAICLPVEVDIDRCFSVRDEAGREIEVKVKKIYIMRIDKITGKMLFDLGYENNTSLRHDVLKFKQGKDLYVRVVQVVYIEEVNSQNLWSKFYDKVKMVI